MKTLFALAALALGITASPAATFGTLNFVRVETSGISVLLPGQPTKEGFNSEACARTDYHYNPRGFDYRVSISSCPGGTSSDYAKSIDAAQRTSKAVRIFENKEMTFGSLTGRFTHFENADGMTIFYWIATRGTRVYQLIAVHEKGYSFNDDAKNMFESARFSN